MKKNIIAQKISFKQTLLTSLIVVAGALSFSNNSHAEACVAKTWARGNTYNHGDMVSSRGHNFKIIQPHTAYAGNWNPENAPALWQDLGECGGSNTSGQTPTVAHKSTSGKTNKPVNKPAVEFGKQTPSQGPSTTVATTVITPPPSTGTNLQSKSGNPNSFPISEAQFNQMYPQRHELYTQEGLVAAYMKFQDFVGVGDDVTKKRELAAFLANIGHETGELVYAEEINKGDYCQPGGQYPCAPGKRYYGRGPIQISWNYNYGTIGDALGLPLLSDPDLVTDVRRGGQVTSWATAIWFWMNSTGAGGMTSHNAMVMNKGFGETIRTINGTLECNGGNPGAVQSRVQKYLQFTAMMGVEPGGNLYC